MEEKDEKIPDFAKRDKTGEVIGTKDQDVLDLQLLEDPNAILNFQAQQLDPVKDVPHDAYIIEIGKRRSGKTTWLGWFLKFRAMIYAEVYVVTNTPQNLRWTCYAPNTRIFGPLDEKCMHHVRELLKMQDEKRRWMNVWMNKYHKSTLPFCPLILLILDDVIDSNSLNRWNEEFNKIVFNGRHIDISCAMLVQDPTGIPPTWRMNADLVVSTFQQQKRSMEYIHHGFFPFTPLNTFMRFLYQNTRDHQVLCFKQDKASGITEMLRISKAEVDDEGEPPIFPIGTKQFWVKSNCDWKEQVKFYRPMRRITKQSFEDYAKLVKKMNRDYRKEIKAWPRTNNIMDANEKTKFIPKEPGEKPKNTIGHSEWAQNYAGVVERTETPELRLLGKFTL